MGPEAPSETDCLPLRRGRIFCTGARILDSYSPWARVTIRQLTRRPGTAPDPPSAGGQGPFNA
ncbi:hypothetical protein GCM10010515_05290 [Streptomyces fructofermentans]|uniref:Uncharacterized protein n=1 Tax=Streptomyces fructofermentans TaxID=152141 RepID=A0A918K2H8_9ACTN|nr:hypothetical protein GCM10010515_05290 [Streptomyces fructofermentans]